MKALKPLHLAWALPLTYSLHLMEEYSMGEGFPAWFSQFIGADLSNTDFLSINALALTAMLLFSFLFSMGSAKLWLVLALGTLLGLNGFMHLVSTVLSASYSPGVITGVLLYLPLAFLIYRKISPRLSEREVLYGICLGVGIQILVAVIAYNI